VIRNENNSGIPLVRLSAINPFLKELASRDVDAGMLLEEHGLPPQIPASSELFVSALSMYSLVERAAELAGDPYLGALVGSKLDLLAWEPISQAARAAGTVGELLNRFIMNAKDHASSVQYRLEIAGNRATFSFRRVLEPPFDPAQNDAFYLGLMTRLMKSATGDAWEPESVLITMSDTEAAPTEFRNMRIVKGDRLGFRMTMPTEWLFERFEKSSFNRRVEESSHTLPPRSLIESVHRALAPHIHEGDLTVDRAAKLCGIDKRPLANSDQKILDIAAKVGFSDPTVFSRAFKSWTGQSPQAFRKNSKLT
jgi:AraC-like DNA-binding protein